MFQTIAEWFSYLQTFPSGLQNPDLERTRKIALRLDLLKHNCQIITVAGTNGKGSCVAILEAILLAAGFKVGAYISPHVLTYNERIRVDAKSIDDVALLEAMQIIENARGEVVLSFFEFTTLVAFYLFKKVQPDFLILEVGLGGRVDPVNLLDANIALIGTIALDHTQILGDNREAIATEKAGIMRPGKPVVCADPHPPVNLGKHATALQAPIFMLGQDFEYSLERNSWSWSGNTRKLDLLPIPRLPVQNAAAVLMVITLLQEHYPSITEKAIITGLKQAFLLGRYQKIVLSNNKEIIVDVAHNPESAALLAQNLAKEKTAGRLIAVMSMLQDKDIAKTVQPLINIIDIWHIGEVGCQRAANIDILHSNLQQMGASQILAKPSIRQALQQAIADCQEKDKIVVFGSFYTVAEVLKLINENVAIGKEYCVC